MQKSNQSDCSVRNRPFQDWIQNRNLFLKSIQIFYTNHQLFQAFSVVYCNNLNIAWLPFDLFTQFSFDHLKLNSVWVKVTLTCGYTFRFICVTIPLISVYPHRKRLSRMVKTICFQPVDTHYISRIWDILPPESLGNSKCKPPFLSGKGSYLEIVTVMICLSSSRIQPTE